MSSGSRARLTLSCRPCSPSSTMHPAKLIGNSCVHHVRNANSIVCPVGAYLQLRAVPSPMLFGELAAHAPKTSSRLQNLQNLQCGCICPPERPASPAGGWRSPSGLLPPTSSPDQFANTNPPTRVGVIRKYLMQDPNGAK